MYHVLWNDILDCIVDGALLQDALQILCLHDVMLCYVKTNSKNTPHKNMLECYCMSLVKHSNHCQKTCSCRFVFFYVLSFVLLSLMFVRFCSGGFVTPAASRFPFPWLVFAQSIHAPWTPCMPVPNSSDPRRGGALLPTSGPRSYSTIWSVSAPEDPSTQIVGFQGPKTIQSMGFGS